MFPTHFDIGFTIIYFFEGFYFLICILIAVSWSYYRIKIYELSSDDFLYLAFNTLLFGFIGAHISHYLFWDTQIFLNDPLIIFRVWESGSSIVGGIIGGIVGVKIYCWKKHISFSKICLIACPPLLLAQCIGRIGCFLNGDAHGVVTNLPWASKFPKYGIILFSFEKDTTEPTIPWKWSISRGLIGPNSQTSAPLHPTQIYESLGVMIILVIILLMINNLDRTGINSKLIFFIYSGGYALSRFFIEFLRADRGISLIISLNLLQIFLFVWGIRLERQ